MRFTVLYRYAIESGSGRGGGPHGTSNEGVMIEGTDFFRNLPSSSEAQDELLFLLNLGLLLWKSLFRTQSKVLAVGVSNDDLAVDPVDAGVAGDEHLCFECFKIQS
mmetsp:Transcript_20214/g.27713  ORF Transcript_20214/g.27713 Transcript_20214/m.27713 type:complete len:106 (+) Transcript_20214:251-568(+)